MERINPESFIGPRSYFTGFDPKITANIINKEKLRIEIERRLKILLLIKSNVVCAASHITSLFTYNIFKENPILLNEGIIIPALRKDKSEIDELFVHKRMKNKEEIVSFYKDNILKTVNWEVEDNSSWFKQQFIKELGNEGSLIRSKIKDLSSTQWSIIVNKIETQEILSREFLQTIINQMSSKSKKIFNNYRDLLYHISGARVVNCESSLPQENYIDYDLADLEQKRQRLSEEQIMWKIYLEMVFETFQKKILPIEFIDYLSFEDIVKMRGPILSSSFQELYDKLMKKVINLSYTGYEVNLLDVNEIEKIRESLHDAFSNIIEDELQYFLKKKIRINNKELFNSSSSIALGLLGFIPGVSYIAGTVGIIKDVPALVFNLCHRINSKESINNINRYLADKERILGNMIAKSEINDKALFINVTEYLTNIIYNKIKI